MSLQITSGLLIKLAGEPAYRRGKQVYENEQIAHLKLSGNTIHASVEGTYPYRVELRITDKILDGVCNCPASDNFDFCKHCVAVALAYANQTENATSNSDKKRIVAYLQSKSKGELIEQLSGLIEADASLQKQWLLKSNLASGVSDTGAIRKQITQSLPYRSIWNGRQVAAYFANAENLFELLLESLKKIEPDKRIVLLQYAYRRLNKALEKIDDSGGYRFGLETQLHNSLISCFHETNWSNRKKATFLSKQLTASYDVYPDIPSDFISDEEDELESIFITQCEDNWLTLTKDSHSSANDPDDFDYASYHLTSILLDHARSRNDYQREIEILTATANKSYDYTNLCEKHIEIEKYEEAEHWLDKAEQSDKYGHSQQTDQLRIKIDIGRGNYSEALKKQWELFKADPGNSNYDQLVNLYKKNKLTSKACYQKAEQYLLDFSKERPTYGGISNTRLLEFYLHHKEFDKAATIAREEAVDVYLLVRIGKAIAQRDPQSAINFYRRSATCIAEQANNRAYARAVSILSELESVLDEQWHDAFYQMVDKVRQTSSLKRKPNFIKALNNCFSQ